MIRRAIIVAGHAIVVDWSRVGEDTGWALLDYQRGEPKYYIEHVRAGVELASADPESLLLFSGGQTREAAGPRSEAQSYWGIADHFAWFGHPDVCKRTVTEEFARDSFENLLLGIARFREYNGNWPERVTLVSWKFKERRFGLHREAIRWPADRFSYCGPNNPEALGQALQSEERAARRYIDDPYSGGEFFAAKRRERNPFRRGHGYLQSSPELAALMRHAGPAPFTGPLPWDVT